MDKAKTESALLHAAAEFINRESNRTSLITVTRVELDDRGQHLTVFVSVFPDEHARTALEFLSRVRDEFAEYIKKTIKIRMIPRIVFLQDPHLGGVIAE
jgi:ribosome-binding factor A